ncbi:MAG TPA: SPW repeat protein [Firmicutes bacterium]|nr:SPW repeat protein [Bacillota bacterium]
MTWQAWVNIILGLWLIVSPWVLKFSDQSTPMWNSIIVGIVVAILSYLQSTQQNKS